MTWIRRRGWPTCWPASPRIRPIRSTISCPGIGVHLKHASIRQPDLGSHLISHVFTITYVAEMLGEDEDWLHELSIDMFPEDGRLYVECGKVRCRNRLHRGRHRELETDHRRHASRRPRASQKTFNGISIPRCSPEAYPRSNRCSGPSRASGIAARF